jgi:hypothetical protein
MLPDLATLRVNAGVTRALQYSLGIFTLTALIGVANALKIFGVLSRDTILTHVHSGTLGFITMGAFGLALWAFGGGTTAISRRNVLITALATVAYILAFWSGNFQARAVFGTIELVVIFGWWWWVFGQVRGAGFGRLDNPRLAMFLALTTLVIGSSLGVAVQIILATGQSLPAQGQGPELIGAHVTAQVSGYLVLFSVGIGEWWLRADRGARSRSGVTQAYLLFIAGLAFSIGALLSIQPLLIVTNLFQLVAVGIFVVRVGGPVLRTQWGSASGLRHVALGPVFLVVNVILLVVLVGQFVAAQGDFTKVSQGLVTAYDHSMFIGVMANVLFGAAFVVAGQRGSGAVDQAIFWLLNLGLIAFLGVLLFAGYDSELVKFSAPIMGLGALLGIVVLSMRLGAATAEAPATNPLRA